MNNTVLKQEALNVYIKPEFFSNTNLPPTENNFEFGTDLAKFLLQELKTVRFIPLSRSILDFESSLWDFTAYSSVQNKKMKFNFDLLENHFHDVVKYWALLEIMKNSRKIHTIVADFHSICSFLNYCYKHHIFEISTITGENIANYLESYKKEKNPTISTYNGKLIAIKSFLTFYSFHFINVLSTSALKALERPDHKLYTAEKNTNKYKLIPESYFNRLLKQFVSVMNNVDLPTDERAFAALMVIETQTGLRASELSMLLSTAKDSIKFDNIEYSFLQYHIKKSAKGNNSLVKCTTYCNELAYEAFCLLYNLHETNRLKYNTPYLYCPENLKTLPVTDTHLRDRFLTFSLNHHSELQCINNEKELHDLHKKITIDSIFETKKKYHKIKTEVNLDRFPILAEFNKTDTVYLPVLHQFRVNVCTMLYRKGVQLEFIRRYMGHLEAEATAYYIRSSQQEDMEYSKETLSIIINEEATLLGSNAKSLTKKIEDFIEKNNFNVATDLDEIINNLTKKIPIRAKVGGICIKSSQLRKCSVDAKTDEFYCAYGVCPNHCHFYFMADISYTEFLNVKKTYEYNLKNGFTRQAEKERNKLVYTLKQRLIPELLELQKELDNHGEDLILKKHPNLSNIITNLNTIIEEANTWTN